MDFKNLCQNIDVRSLRARIPSMPTMPQIKLPKSLPKLRSRRIFSRSRDDLGRSKGSSSIKEQKLQQHQQSNSFQHLSTQSIIPPADFINHTPQRISTISSLMSQEHAGGAIRSSGDSQRGTYRSAHSVDDDYPSPRQFHTGGRLSRHMSPIQDVSSINGGRGGASGVETTVVKMTFTEKLQKGCKDISEFRLSHIFAKKTVVRKDMIQVDQYVERFNEDREREQAEEERHERKLADNYRFDFKLSRQDTDNSKRSVSPMESPKQQHTRMPDQSEDESGMEATPPLRKPGIASTRFARVRKPPLEQYITDEESNNELDEDADKVQQALQRSPPAREHSKQAPESRTTKALHKLRSLSKRSEETPEKASEKKRRAPLTPQQSQEQVEQHEAPNPDNDGRFNTLKQNVKRFSKSLRRGESRTTTANTGDEATEDEGPGTPKKDKTKQASRAEKFTARLRKFASHEASTEQLDDETVTPKKSDESRSPIRAAISNKLQTWKKSFKRKPSEADDDDGRQTGEETSPEHAVKEKQHPDSLMKKLNKMRQRKRASSTDELADDGTEDETTKTASTKKSVNFEERFEQARKRTFKKVNEKMHQMNFFSKSQEQLDKAESAGATKKSSIEVDDEQSGDERTVYVHPSRRTAARRAAACDTPTDSEEEEDGEQSLQPAGGAYAVKDINNTQAAYNARLPARAVWTTKNLLTESLDSETDSEFPRVLIHQDNSDQYESTLIIVTRPAPSLPTTSTIIEEIRDDDEVRRKQKPPRPSRSPSLGSARAEWIPNNESISNFLDLTPPSKRRLSAETILPPRGHARKMSLDSNSDSDSWIPESARTKNHGHQSRESSVEGATGLTLNTIGENEEAWKVHRTFGEEKLYKAKSIDIFEASVHKGGVSAAFDDFEDELRNEPVLRVPQQRHVDSSFEKDSSEEPFAVDDDNSSRVTRISVSVIREECEEMLENAELIKLPPQVGEREFCNSRESLIAHSMQDDKDGYEDDDEDDEDDRPPSVPPSPPPSISPPLPPLPPRKPILMMSKSIEESSPPRATKPPTIKPPTPPPPTKPSAPPRIPDRTPSMSRISKPLVKTSSLRLAYDEQVNPSDVGKVNKLITRFETSQTNAPPPTLRQRPRIIRRRLTRDESEEYSDDEDDLEEESDSEQDSLDTHDTERDVTPTPTNTPRTYSLESDTESVRHANSTQASIATTNKKQASLNLEDIKANIENGNQTKLCSNEVPKITLNFDTNSNLSLSCTSSEYGSPLEYPSSLIGSTETTPIPERKAQEPLIAKNGDRNRRSMTRDDDKFLSFDSDDENSYYSISSTSSSRYVVEI